MLTRILLQKSNLLKEVEELSSHSRKKDKENTKNLEINLQI